MTVRQIPPALTQTWVFIGFTHQLKPASAKPIHVMNRDLVLWKSQSGVISLQDAYCPHMGAHLGRGKIRGELLECIFHKRKFDTAGKCQGVGRNNKSYPVSLLHDMIFAWFGETAPTWQVPDFLSASPDMPNSKWKILSFRKMNYNFHPKDLLDNTVDASHFKTFHNQCLNFKPAEILETSSHHFISRVIFNGKLKIKDIELNLVTESYGPATLVVNSVVNVHQQKFFFKFVFLCTPIQNENTDYTLAVAALTEPREKISWRRKIFEFFYNHYAFQMQVKEFKKESEQVWNQKTYLRTPDLYAQEDAIRVYTEWYEQFYVKTPETQKPSFAAGWVERSETQ